MSNEAKDDGLAVTLTIKQLKAVVRDAVREERESAAHPPGATKRYMESKEIAAHYGVSRATVNNWTKEEGCPHILKGKVLRFELAAVEEWFRGREPGLRRVK